jgi:diguanylate cyclase (GGDEF)-like protein/PAS domain S-box-containing protein
VEDALEPVRQAQEGAVFRAFMLSRVFIIAVLALLFALGRYGHAMRRLALREAHTRNLLEHMVEGIMVVDANQRIIAVNPALCEISGYREAELLGASPALLSGGSPGAGGLMDLLAGEEGEAAARGGDFQALRPGGTPYTAHARVSVVSSETGGGTNRLVLIADVTELRRKTDEIWQRANFDVVTGLPNRALLHDRLERMIRHARRQQTHVLILFVDLDRFKPVNDTYGHEFGDRLLVEVGRRLEGLFREEDTVGRLGGDEFVVLIPATHGHELAGPAALKVVEQLSQPFEIDGQGVDISASVGVACFPDDGDVPEDLIAAADAAMYRAKHAGRATWRA